MLLQDFCRFLVVQMGLIHPLQPPLMLCFQAHFGILFPLLCTQLKLLREGRATQDLGAALAPRASSLHRASVRLALKQEELLPLHQACWGHADHYKLELRGQLHRQCGQLNQARSGAGQAAQAQQLAAMSASWE